MNLESTPCNSQLADKAQSDFIVCILQRLRYLISAVHARALSSFYVNMRNPHLEQQEYLRVGEKWLA